MRFDAYCASLQNVELSRVVGTLSDSLGAVQEKARPRQRFAAVVDLMANNRMVAWVGQSSDTGLIYVEGKGETSPRLAQSIRAQFPEHSVPRADVCDDYNEPGVFDRLRGIILANKGQQTKSGYIALPDDVQDGKTWAVGKRGAVVYTRLYEAGKHPDRVHLNMPDLTRFEGEFRPHYARDKAMASRMKPSEFFGFTKWSHQVFYALSGIDVPRVEIEPHVYSQDKTTRYLANTFRRHWEELLADGLHLEATLRQVWAEEDERQAKSKERPKAKP